MAFLEGNPFTFPEVQTLLDGVTVGGHKLTDEARILNTAEAWKLLFRLVENGVFEISKDVFCKLHRVTAKGEALTFGEFRDGEVGISGTEYKSPECEKKFFWVGNKRTSRLMMAGELLKCGLDIASIPASKKLEFNQKMIRFFDFKEGSEMMQFWENCII